MSAPSAASPSRRGIVRTIAAAGIFGMIDPAIRNVAWAAGSEAPEKKEVKIGFIPLTDCASVVMASVNEFDKKYGVKIATYGIISGGMKQRVGIARAAPAGRAAEDHRNDR